MSKRLNTLQARLAVYVFCVMLLSNLCTGAVSILVHRAGLLRPLYVTQLMSPIWMIVFSTALGGFFSAWLGRYYLRPLKRLILATRQVAKGDFSVRLPEESRGEVTELIRSFSSMAGELGSIEIFRNDFVSNVSHELKTPIASICGFARQLQREDLTEAQRQECAAIIVSESERLSHLASNILMLSKLENQQILTEQETFRLDEQLRSCILLLEKQWECKQLSLEVELEAVICHTNAAMLSQCWINLLGNAIKFTPEKGSIAVRLHREGGSAVVEIRDTGIGMNRQTLEHMFEKFYQGDRSHSTQGNGLGLALCRRIVDLCGGSIRAESEVGKGTAFTVALPLEAPSEQ